MKLARLGTVVIATTVFTLIAQTTAGAATAIWSDPTAKRYQRPLFSAVSISRNVPYGSAIGLNKGRVRLRLDLYQPAGDTAPQRPALIWAHGGSFQGGDKVDQVATSVASLFAEIGYVTASINYRRSPLRTDATPPTCQPPA